MTPHVELVRRDDGRHGAVIVEPRNGVELDASDLRELALALLDAAATLERLDDPPADGPD